MTSVTGFAGRNYDKQIVRGNTEEFHFTVSEPGDPETLLDITDWSWSFRAEYRQGGVMAKVHADFDIEAPEDGGPIILRLSEDDTAEFPIGRAYYEIEAQYDVDGRHHEKSFLRGYLNVVGFPP